LPSSRRADRARSGCKNVLRCQYHGWTYTLDGRLIGTPDVEGVEFLDRSTMAWCRFAARTWDNYLCEFRSGGGAAVGLPRPEFLSRHKVSIRGFAICRAPRLRHRAIGKFTFDNYLEAITFHRPSGLMKEIDYAPYRTDTFRYYSQQFAPIRAMKAETRGSALRGPARACSRLLLLGFPNLMLNISRQHLDQPHRAPLPRKDAYDLRMVFPRCRLGEKSEPSPLVAFSDEVQQEDIGLCENVSVDCALRPMTAGATPSSAEKRVHHFHMLLGEFLGSRKRR